MNGFPRKPLRRDDLVSTINSMFSNRSTADANPPEELEQDAILALKNDFGPAKLEYLFQKFTFDAQSFIAELRTAIEAGTIDDIRRSSHRIGGLFGQFGAIRQSGQERYGGGPSGAVRVRPNLGCAREARLTANGLRCAPQATSMPIRGPGF